MAVETYPCTASNDDRQLGDNASTTTTVGFAVFDNFLATESSVRVDIDTSGLAGKTILGATLYWYNNAASTKSKNATWDHRIRFNGGATIYQNTSGAEPAGWNSHALTAGELASLNTAGDTQFLFWVPDPGSTYGRTWPIRQWDYAPNGDYSAYLEVTVADTGSPGKTTILTL